MEAIITLIKMPINLISGLALVGFLAPEVLFGL